jgi:protein-S-isoprenylcysteine O-methyltransferase Ste14
MLLVPFSAVFTLVIAAFFPMTAEAIRGLGKGVVLVTVILLALVTSKFKRYAKTPGSADAFRTRASRRLTWSLFYLMPLLGTALLVVAFRASSS